MSNGSLNGDNFGSGSYGKLIFYIVLVLVVIAGSSYLFFAQKMSSSLKGSVQTEVIQQINVNGQLGNAKDEVMANLGVSSVNGKYGEWPILEVIPASPDRGNPFISVSGSK
jgi:hypothetical protein